MAPGFGTRPVLLMDQAGWHMTDKVDVPDNISVLPIPSRSPELNPVENIWQFMRDNWLANRIFTSARSSSTIVASPGTSSSIQPWRIMSIGMRNRAKAF